MRTAEHMISIVDAYVAAFEAGSVDRVVELYAEGATVEDPIGAPIITGLDAIRAFYAGSMATGARLELYPPVRIAGDYAAFSFSVHLRYGGHVQRIDVIDTFKFDPDGKIIEMRAYWGETNMTEYQEE